MRYEQLFPSDACADALLSAVPDMMRESEKARLQCVAPTQHQRDAVHSVITQFATANGRKMHGAWALRQALSTIPVVAPGDLEVCDGVPALEFYSPDPINDAMDIANRLFTDGHRYVQVREAAAHGTYTISVEFVRLCNITYAPKRVFAAIPTLPNHDAPAIVSPSFMIMEYMRVLCDPFTSYWRLDRILPRLVALQRYFPIAVPQAAAPDHYHGQSAPVAAAIQWAASRPTCASVVEHARAYFMGPDEQARPPIRQLTVVSADYVTNLVSLADAFDAFEGDGVQVVEHCELLNLIGRRSVLRVDGRVVAVLIDAGGRSVPVCGRADDGLMVAGFSYCMLVSMALRFLATVGARQGTESAAARFHGAVIGDMLQYRKNWEGGDPVCSPSSPFRDVALSYIGWPRSDMRVHMEMTDRRRVEVGSARPTVWLTYDPNKPNVKPYKYRMLRCDGDAASPANATLLQARATARLVAQLGAPAAPASAPAPAPAAEGDL